MEPLVVRGELLAGGKDVFRRLSGEAARVWQVNLALAADGELPLKTEGHVLSIVLPILPSDESRNVADRIWTAARYRTVNGTEGRLLIWHLPSEKGRGFRRLLQATLDTSSWFWAAPRKIFVEEVSRRMRVTERSPLLRARDWVGQLSQRLRSRSNSLFSAWSPRPARPCPRRLWRRHVKNNPRFLTGLPELVGIFGPPR